MLQTAHAPLTRPHAGQSPVRVDSFFFPAQFSGRSTLASVQALAQAHGGQVQAVTELAASLGIGLPSQVGVQDLMRAAEWLGLQVQLEQLHPKDLAGKALPALLLCPGGASAAQVLVLAHCDHRYTVTHDHTSAVPLTSMGPLHLLADQWAPTGLGWCLSVTPKQV